MAQVSTLSVEHDLSPQPDLLFDAIPEPRRGPILVVEDRDDVREGLTQLLELHGFRVVDAPDAVQAEAIWTAVFHRS